MIVLQHIHCIKRYENDRSYIVFCYLFFLNLFPLAPKSHTVEWHPPFYKIYIFLFLGTQTAGVAARIPFFEAFIVRTMNLPNPTVQWASLFFFHLNTGFLPTKASYQIENVSNGTSHLHITVLMATYTSFNI